MPDTSPAAAKHRKSERHAGGLAAGVAAAPEHARAGAMLFIFAERYRQQPDQVTSIVIIGNATALFFMPLALRL